VRKMLKNRSTRVLRRDCKSRRPLGLPFDPSINSGQAGSGQANLAAALRSVIQHSEVRVLAFPVFFAYNLPDLVGLSKG